MKQKTVNKILLAFIMIKNSIKILIAHLTIFYNIDAQCYWLWLTFNIMPFGKNGKAALFYLLDGTETFDTVKIFEKAKSKVFSKWNVSSLIFISHLYCYWVGNIKCVLWSRYFHGLWKFINVESSLQPSYATCRKVPLYLLTEHDPSVLVPWQALICCLSLHISVFSSFI